MKTNRMLPLKLNMSLYTVKGVLIVDNSGNKILTKYYSDDLKEKSSQEEVESAITSSNKVDDGRVIVLKNYLILYKEISDFVVYIVGGADENEMILCEIVNVLCSTLALVIKPTLEKTSLLRKYDKLVLILDQMIENGIILSLNEEEIATMISNGGMGVDLLSSDQLIFQYIQKAQEHLVNTLF